MELTGRDETLAYFGTTTRNLVAAEEPQSRYVDGAGPETQDLVDMARCTSEVRGRTVKLVPRWSGIFAESMAGNVLLPGGNAHLSATTFDDWLAAGAQ